MDDSNYDLHRLEILEYEVLSRPHRHSPGYNGLRLVQPRKSAGHELETLILTIIDWRGRPYISKIHADTTPDESFPVAPGRIDVRSHLESEGSLYTYGGTLTVERLARETLMTIVSSAPLLELSPQPETVANLLAAESEALFGQMETIQAWSHTELLEHLIAAGPLAVYLAVLQSLSIRYEAEDPLLGRLHPELLSLFRSEKSWYGQSGQWSATQPDLETLINKL